MTSFTDGADADLAGGFNWTFDLGADLAVPEHAFSAGDDLGIFSWRYDAEQAKGIVRMYQRVSKSYPWLCTYFGAVSAVPAPIHAAVRSSCGLVLTLRRRWATGHRAGRQGQ